MTWWVLDGAVYAALVVGKAFSEMGTVVHVGQ